MLKKIRKLKKLTHKYRFYLIGIFFIILQFMLLYKYLYLAEFNNMLWFCSHAPLLFGLAFFFKKIKIIKGLISVGLIIQLIWIVDYLGKLLFGIYLIGTTDYMFLYQSTFFSYIVSVIEHFSSILALFLTYKYKPKKEIFYYSFFYLIIILIFTLIFSSPEENFNLVYNMIIFNEFTFTGYTFSWIFLAMIILVLPTYYFQLWLYKLSIRNKN